VETIVGAYLGSVGRVCADVLGESLEAVWVVGSLATGDFEMRRSDIDVLVISRRSLARDEKASLAQLLCHRSLPCPAHGLDLLVYRASEVSDLRRAPCYEFSISSGVDWDDEVSLGGPYPGGLIDLAIAHDCGTPILGPRPSQMTGKCPVVWIVEELQKGIEWHKGRIHDPFHDPSGANAVLNACRALYFLSHNAFASKSAGARWLLSTRPSPVVAEALARRRDGRTSGQLDERDVLAFLGLVGAELEKGAS